MKYTNRRGSQAPTVWARVDEALDREICTSLEEWRQQRQDTARPEEF